MEMLININILLCYYLYMKSLKSFEKDLNKCSKCGLCESVCPLFKINPNDCVASKGKFIMLHGVTKGDLELSDNINKYIDMCLKCGKCKEFCPSDIDVCQILNTAKYEYSKGKSCEKVIKFLQGKYIFDLVIKLGKLLSNPFRKKILPPSKDAIKVIYFKGCVNHIFPQTDNYINKIFKNDIKIIESDFECCGLPFLSEGNMEKFIISAKHNLQKLKEVEYDYIVTDCASCAGTLLDYPKYLPARLISPEKVINFGNLIALKDYKFKFKKPIKVTFHKPCHLKNDIFMKKIFENCENVEYVPMEDYDDCCGFAGSFALKNPKLSQKLTKQKAEKIKQTKADYVITTCPSCILGLKQGLFLTAGKTKVVSLLEFLAMGVIK